jgi:hypothetical protein
VATRILRDERLIQSGHAPLARDGLAVVSIALALLLGVVIFLPAEGLVAGPLQDGIGLLLGRATFMLPLGLLVTGVVVLARGLRPDSPLPYARLAGVTIIALAALPTQHLVGLDPGASQARAAAHEGGGLVGHALSTALLDALGGPGTAIVLSLMLVLGSLLTFDITVGEAATFVAGVLRAAWSGGRGLWRPMRRVDPALALPVSASETEQDRAADRTDSADSEVPATSTAGGRPPPEPEATVARPGVAAVAPSGGRPRLRLLAGAETARLSGEDEVAAN